MQHHAATISPDTPGRRAALMTALLLGLLSIPIALVVSGYIAIGAAGAGLILTHAASDGARRPLTRPAYTLSAIGLALGLSAQIMKWIVMLRT